MNYTEYYKIPSTMNYTEYYKIPSTMNYTEYFIVVSHSVSCSYMTVLDRVDWDDNLSRVTANLALSCGSSKQGKTFRASVGWRWLVAKYLQECSKSRVPMDYIT